MRRLVHWNWYSIPASGMDVYSRYFRLRYPVWVSYWADHLSKDTSKVSRNSSFEFNLNLLCVV
jgi:hypothetical protein